MVMVVVAVVVVVAAGASSSLVLLHAACTLTFVKPGLHKQNEMSSRRKFLSTNHLEGGERSINL